MPVRKVINFLKASPSSQSPVGKSFYIFYLLQLFIFTSSLARSTAIGFVIYHLGASPQDLGLMTSIACFGLLAGYWATPKIHKALKSANLVFALAQKCLVFSSLILLAYTFWGIYKNDWGNFWVWAILNSIISSFTSIEQSSRPLMVKRAFSGANFSHIMRQDVLTLGMAKIIGFGAGAFILSKSWVLFTFFLCTIASLSMLHYIKIMRQKNLLTPDDKLKESNLIEPIPGENAVVMPQDNEEKISYASTLSMHIVTCLLLFPISTQAITYSKIWNVPFYWFLVVSSLGNVLFNVVINPRSGLKLKKAYLLYVTCIVIGFLLFLSQSIVLVLTGSFLVGGAYASLSALSTSRLYEGLNKTHKSGVWISRFYIIGGVTTMIGGYLLGYALNHYNKNHVFIFLSLITIAFYYIPFLVMSIRQKKIEHTLY